MPEEVAPAAIKEVAPYERDIAALRTRIGVLQALGGLMVLLMGALLWHSMTLSAEVDNLAGNVAGLRDAMIEMEKSAPP